jgi:signal transduction histidine kinase
VKDEGPGISETNKKRVFDQFYRVGDEATRNTKGTGLGLYIVKKIVNAHNGNISIENNIPSGSVFKVTIPK